jgi:hypothetical protein
MDIQRPWLVLTSDVQVDEKMNNPFLEAAIQSHIEKYRDDSHENDCAICIAYSLGLQDSKPF